MDGFAVLTSRASHMCDNLKLSQRPCNQLHNVVSGRRVGQRRACAARQLPTRLGSTVRFEFRNEAIRSRGLALNVLSETAADAGASTGTGRAVRHRLIPNEVAKVSKSDADKKAKAASLSHTKMPVRKKSQQ